jgi:hypothetical protein
MPVSGFVAPSLNGHAALDRRGIVAVSSGYPPKIRLSSEEIAVMSSPVTQHANPKTLHPNMLNASSFDLRLTVVGDGEDV